MGIGIMAIKEEGMTTNDHDFDLAKTFSNAIMHVDEALRTKLEAQLAALEVEHQKANNRAVERHEQTKAVKGLWSREYDVYRQHSKAQIDNATDLEHEAMNEVAKIERQIEARRQILDGVV